MEFHELRVSCMLTKKVLDGASDALEGAKYPNLAEVSGLDRRPMRVICGMSGRTSYQEPGSELKRVLFDTADAWLKEAVQCLQVIFKEKGYDVPPLRLHFGWTSRGVRTNRIGECWPKCSVNDGITTIFITNQLQNSVAVLDVLMHEMVHAVDDCKHRHGKEFAKIAKEVGLSGPPWRSAGADEALMTKLDGIANTLGHLPYSPIRPPVPVFREMQSGRAVCPLCGYSCRTLSKWSNIGPPWCPKHGVPLEEEWRLG